MPNPTKYIPGYSFSGFQAVNPAKPLPAPRLDDELANIAVALGATIDGLTDIRRSDGKLKNDIVALEALAPAVRAAIATGGGAGGSGALLIGDIDGLPAALDAKADRTAVLALDDAVDELTSSTASALGAKADLVNGKVPAAQLPATGGSNDAALVLFKPDPTGFPTLAIPVSERLGAEVSLTDGYKTGDNLTDFSDLIAANLARAIATGRPFVVPGGKFGATRQFTGAGKPVTIFGQGKTLSAIEWLAGSVSTGLRFTFDNDDDYGTFENFGLLTKLFNVGTALECDFSGKVIPNNGNPVVFSRFQPCGRAKNLLVRGSDGTLVNGFQRGIRVVAPLAFHVQDCDLWGASAGADPNYASEEAIYLGAVDGYGHPVECLVQNNRVFRHKVAFRAEGMEGVFAQNNNFVGVGTGIHFKDTLGRPQLNAKNNHINAALTGILVDNCCQFNVEGNLIYLVIGANTTGTGVLIRGANTRWGGIVNNDFENTDTANSGSKLNAIVVESGKDITIDLNRYRRNCPATISGVWLTSGAQRVKVGDGEVYEQAGGPFGGVDFGQLDQGAENFVPGQGARYGKNTAQNLQAGAPNTIAFQTAERVKGNMPANLPIGEFTVPAEGVWEFAAGCALGAAGGTGGSFINITLNGTDGGSALASGGAYSGSSDTPAMSCATGPVPCAKGDVVRVVVNPGFGRDAAVRPATFFNVRRVA